MTQADTHWTQDAEYFEREWTACGGEQIYCPPARGRDLAA